MYSTYDQEMADDDLQKIVDLKAEYETSIGFMKRYFGRQVTPEAISAMEQAFDETFYEEWHRLREISGCIEWPIEIPPFGTLSFKTPVDKANEEYKRTHTYREHIVTNPATLIEVNKLDAQGDIA